MTTARPFKKLRSVNASDANFPTFPALESYASLLARATDAADATSRVPILLTPHGGNGVIPAGIDLFPYGLGSDNDVFSLRLIGWRRVLPAIADGRVIMVPSMIGEIACTISAYVGAAGFNVINTERFADTITIVKEETITADTTRAGVIETFSPANDTPAHATIWFEGYEFIEPHYDQTTGTATMNALYSLISDRQ